MTETGSEVPELKDSLSSTQSEARPEWAVLSAGGYRCIRLLGRGQYGTAHLVESSSALGDVEQAVAKVVFLDHLKDRDRALAQQEVEVLKRLQHPHVVRHHASWLHRGGGGPDAGEALVSVMEYCAGGDLRDFLDQCSKGDQHLPEASVLSLFAQMLKGIRYVHSCRILHRDLKTSNMLLDAPHQVVKIGDFGIARILESTAAVAATMLGTPYYMSPEVCKGEPYREKSDMWSLGCVLYEMCVLRHAFESQSLLGLVYCIVSEHYDPIPADLYGAELAELVALLLAKSAEERPSAEQALALPVLQPYSSDDACLPETAFAQGLREHSAAPPPPPPRPRKDLIETCVPQPPPSPGITQVQPPGARPLAEIQPPEQVARPSPPAPKVRAQRLGPGGQPPPPPEPGPSSPSAGPYSSASSWRAGRSQMASSPSAGARPQPMGASPSRAAPVSDEAQVLLSRARKTLLRRPRAKGNWVQAFARHDTTGVGELSPVHFAAFLKSLSLGLSDREVEEVVSSLLADRPAISLFVFGEAIENASPGDTRFGEAEALSLASQLAGASPKGLAAFAGQGAREVLASAAEDLDPEMERRFALWLPKLPDGHVDWPAAEEWRLFGADAK